MSETAITLTSAKVPAHIKEASGLGNENISAEHLQTPRVKLLQQLNNEVDENHNDYIEGTKPGDLINTVTRENYGKELYEINVFCKEDFVLWKKRESGGGLVGTYPSQQAALSYLEQEGLKAEDHEIIQTQSHVLLRKDEKTGDLLQTPFTVSYTHLTLPTKA